MVGFESMISSQIITLQIKDKSKIEDCFLDCCHASNGVLNGKRAWRELLLGPGLLRQFQRILLTVVWRGRLQDTL